MSTRRLQLRRRRLELQMKAAGQRAQIAAITDDVRQSLGKIDHTLASVRRWFTSPWVIGGVLAAMLILKPAGVVRWGGRIGMFLSLYRRLRFSRSAET